MQSLAPDLRKSLLKKLFAVLEIYTNDELFDKVNMGQAVEYYKLCFGKKPRVGSRKNEIFNEIREFKKSQDW